MKELPTPATLAALVSRVTETMFGMQFQITPAETRGLPWNSTEPWRIALLPINGTQPLTVAIASNHGGAAALGSAMFSCTPAEVDPSMADDSLSELANIVAGQVKSALEIDQALGLPRVMEAPKEVDEHLNRWRNATLKNHDKQVKVWVAIAETIL